MHFPLCPCEQAESYNLGVRAVGWARQPPGQVTRGQGSLLLGSTVLGLGHCIDFRPDEAARAGSVQTPNDQLKVSTAHPWGNSDHFHWLPVTCLRGRPLSGPSFSTCLSRCLRSPQPVGVTKFFEKSQVVTLMRER